MSQQLEEYLHIIVIPISGTIFGEAQTGSVTPRDSVLHCPSEYFDLFSSLCLWHHHHHHYYYYYLVNQFWAIGTLNVINNGLFNFFVVFINNGVQWKWRSNRKRIAVAEFIAESQTGGMKVWLEVC